MLAVKNSMKRSLVRGPAAVIAAGNMSMPARMSAGGAAITSSAVKTMGSFGSLGMDPPPPHPLLLSIIKEVMQYKKPNKVDLQLSNSAMEPINHRGLKSMAVSLQAQSIA